jgi:molybdopterin-synthase adenylyltransferase
MFVRPRVRPEHRPYRIAGGRIRIGGGAYSIAAEVTDPTGSIWTLLSAMDGTREAAQIVAEVQAAHPEVKADTVRSALAQFVEAGYVDDAAQPPPPALTARDQMRHDRGRRFYRWIDPRPNATGWEPILAMRQARITVVGLGGTGGHAAMALAAGGAGRLHCVDDDKVELSNLNRQILYTEQDLGRRKANAAADRLRAINSDIQVTTSSQAITGEADLKALAGGCDVLVLCADRPHEITSWTNLACLATRTPWVDAGYDGPGIAVAAYVPGQGPCLECHRASERDRLPERAAENGPEGKPANAVIAPSAGISGQLAAMLAMALVTGVPAITPGQIRGLSLIAPEHSFVLTDPRLPDCAACGELP